MLEIGDKMPEFEAVDQDGNTVRSSDLKGKKTVVYFYRKDKNPGCTAAAGNQSATNGAGGGAREYVVGVSKDSEASHKKFALKNSLPFTLLADPSTQILQAFGAWGEKKMYGKVTVGTLRKTFIFSEDGTLEKIIEKVDTKNHAAQILE